MNKKTSFRSGPVPFTGGGHGFKLYRTPKTTNERRAAEAAECELGKQFVRGRRRSGKLVNSWDDIVRSQERSWKRHRHKQWKC